MTNHSKTTTPVTYTDIIIMKKRMLKIVSNMVLNSKTNLNIVYVKGMGFMKIYILALIAAGNSITFVQIKKLTSNKNKINKVQ